MKSCHFCKKTAPVVLVEYMKVTGLILIRTMETIKGLACAECVESQFNDAQSHTALFGWWSITSLIATPIALAANRANLGRARSLVSMLNANPQLLLAETTKEVRP